MIAARVPAEMSAAMAVKKYNVRYGSLVLILAKDVLDSNVLHETSPVSKTIEKIINEAKRYKSILCETKRSRK